MRLAFALVALAIIPALLWGQSDRGTITGSVTDPAGAVIPAATIVATNIGTGVQHRTQSTETGNYTIPLVPAGEYNVFVEHTGFRRYEQRGVSVQVAQTARVDIVLQVGSTADSITVTADAAILKTDSAEQSVVLSTDTLNALPLNFSSTGSIRNPLNFATLAPGTALGAWNSIKVNGLPQRSYRVMFDGQDSTNAMNPRVADEMTPSIDAVQEFAIQSSGFAAEFGQVGGGLFNFTSRSGTASVHGTLYEYFTNEALNASMPFTDDGKGSKIKTRVRQNDFGGNLGGPLWIPKVYEQKDRTFFFFNYEQYRNIETRFSGLGTLPTTRQRQGDFGEFLTNRVLGQDPLGRNILDGQIFDPQSGRLVNGVMVRDPFPGNRIPSNMLDPVALKIQNLLPAIDPRYEGLTTLNYEKRFPADRIQKTPSIKIDHNIGSMAKISGYYAYLATDLDVGGEGLPDPISARRELAIRSHTTRLSYDHTIRPTLLWHVGVGYQRYRNPDATAIQDYDSVRELGLRGALVPGFPRFEGTLLPTPFGTTNYQLYLTDKPTANTSVTWVRGSHTFKFGGEWRIDAFSNIANNGAYGIYNFDPQQTGQPSTQAQNLGGGTVGNAWASFLLGRVNTASINNPSSPQYRRAAWGFYAQDTWKVAQRLTLELGLRYDIEDPARELWRRTTMFSFTTPNPAAGGLLGAAMFEGNGPGRCNCDFASTYRYGFSPRFGLAYQFNTKTVLRAGFGISYASMTPFNYIGSGNSLGFEWNRIDFSPTGFGEAALQLQNGLVYDAAALYRTNFDPGLRPVPGRVNQNLPNHIDRNAGRPPKIFNWSIGVQRELTKNMTVEANYVANRGVWLRADNLHNYNANTPERLASFGFDVNNPADLQILASRIDSPQAIARGIRPPFAGFPMSETVAQALRPYPQFGGGNGTGVGSMWAPIGNSWYDSLQVKFNHRTAKGLTLSGSYTWSKNLSNVDDSVGGGTQVNDVFNHGLQKTFSATDQPHIFVASGVYELPLRGIGGSGRLVRGLLDGWEVSGVVRYASGYPIPVPRANNNLLPIMFRNTVVNRVEGQPLFLKDPNCGCIDPYKDFALNPNAWANPPAGQFGTAAPFYNDYRWQRRPDEQFSIGKITRIREGMTLEIRAQFFNIFNRINFLPVPDNTNFQSSPRFSPQGVIQSGFGRVDLATISAGQDRKLVDLPYPRQGQIVARFRF